MASEGEKEGYQLTKENLARGIANHKNCGIEDVEIQEFSLRPGSKPGENYLCVMFAVDIEATVQGKPETFYYMAKCLPANEFRAKYLNGV